MKFSHTAPVRDVPSDKPYAVREFTGQHLFSFEFDAATDAEAIAILNRAFFEVSELVRPDER